MKREPAEPQGFIKLTGVGIPRLQAGEDVNSHIHMGRFCLVHLLQLPQKGQQKG